MKGQSRWAVNLGFRHFENVASVFWPPSHHYPHASESASVRALRKGPQRLAVPSNLAPSIVEGALHYGRRAGKAQRRSIQWQRMADVHPCNSDAVFAFSIFELIATA